MSKTEGEPNLKSLTERLGAGKDASWDTTVSFLTDERVTSHPVLPARSKEENRADPYPFWPPKPQRQTEDEWVRQYETLEKYADGVDQIEDGVNVSRERIRQIKDRAIVTLQLASPSDVQEAYPLENLTPKRPRTLGSRQRRSESLLDAKGVSRQILKDFAAGKSVPELQASKGAQRIAQARRVLSRSEGAVKMPYLVERKSAETRRYREEALVHIKNGDWDTKATQAFFDGLHRGEIGRLLQINVLTPLGGISEKAGIRLRYTGSALADIATNLKAMGVVTAVSELYTDKRGYSVIYYGVLTEKVAQVEALLRTEVFDQFRK